MLETDDDITKSTWARMAEKVMLDDKQTLRIANLKLQASWLAVLEIFLEDIEGYLDDGEFEHTDRYSMNTRIAFYGAPYKLQGAPVAWRGDRVLQTAYRSHMNLMVSNHWGILVRIGIQKRKINVSDLLDEYLTLMEVAF